jgi:hypothetical protein
MFCAFIEVALKRHATTVIKRRVCLSSDAASIPNFTNLTNDIWHAPIAWPRRGKQRSIGIADVQQQEAPLQNAGQPGCR